MSTIDELLECRALLDDVREKLGAYQTRRKAEDCFEIEELLDLLDSITDSVVEPVEDADDGDADEPAPELYP